jgi:hypothetical protein
MAFSLRLTGIKWQDGVATAITFPGDVPGGGIDRQDARFRDISEDAGYLDYYAVLSQDEALQIVKDREWLVESWMKYDARSPARAVYEAMINAIRESDLVIAHDYEWESGLGD